VVAAEVGVHDAGNALVFRGVTIEVDALY